MASKTTNFNLTKPSAEDFYDIGVQNANMDIIDAEMKSMADESKRIDTDAKTNFEAHTTASNPHKITASTVGLGNVPNVATNDQTPTYSEASTLTNLASGEKLSVAFGKIKKAISNVITHLADSVKHITAAERTAWNNTTTVANNSATIVSNGGFSKLLDYEVNLPITGDKSRTWRIPIPNNLDITAMKVVVKGQIMGEVHTRKSGASTFVGVHFGQSYASNACYYRTFSTDATGSFSCVPFEVTQEFIVSRRIYESTPQPIAMNMSNPSINLSYAYPVGLASNVVAGESGVAMTDFVMLLTTENAYSKAGFVGTIEVYVK